MIFEGYGSPDLPKILGMARGSERRRIELTEFARRLTLSIEGLELSKAAFGRTIGVDRGRLHNWTAGICYPDIEALLRMQRVHGLDPNWLLLGRTAALPSEIARKLEQAAQTHGVKIGA